MNRALSSRVAMTGGATSGMVEVSIEQLSSAMKENTRDPGQ